MNKTAFGGRILVLGFGAIGQALLPLLQRHVDVDASSIDIVAPTAHGIEEAREYGVRLTVLALGRDNYVQALAARLRPGDLLLNLAVDVGSCALMALCQERGWLYIDACTEAWAGVYEDARRPAAERTNYRLREEALALRRPGERPTALITLGANPGLVSFLVKQALRDLAGAQAAIPSTAQAWAALARDLGIRAIHVAERDTQASARRKAPDEFVNTWSVDGFVSEGLQPAELGWGTHERHFPADAAEHDEGCRAAIYLDRPGIATRVRSWTPLAGPYIGFLVTHAESISIAAHLTLGDPARPTYRPTVHYAYHPCDDAVLSLHELEGRHWHRQAGKVELRDDVVSGRDELGVLLMGHREGAYWLGSQLTIDQARELCPFNNATSLQVAAPLVAGIAWAIRHPAAGILEPDDLPFDEMLATCRPYLGDVVGVRTDWTPLKGRRHLFDEPLDPDDPWQFVNVRVS